MKLRYLKASGLFVPDQEAAVESKTETFQGCGKCGACLNLFPVLCEIELKKLME